MPELTYSQRISYVILVRGSKIQTTEDFDQIVAFTTSDPTTVVNPEVLGAPQMRRAA